jgi:hypothetical protein
MRRLPEILLLLLLAGLSANAQQSRPATGPAVVGPFELPDIPLLPEDRGIPRSPEPPAPGAGLFHFDLTPYGGYIDYHHSSVKKQAFVSGVYGSVGYGSAHLLEGEVDYINRANRFISDLHQWDCTLIYSNFSIPHWKFRAGAHHIESTDEPSDGAWVAIAGAEYHFAGAWDAGVDAYCSWYENFNPRLTVFQCVPHLGLEVLKSPDRHLRNDLRLYWIDIGDDVGVGRQQMFSVEDRLAFTWRQWTLGACGWIGQQTFAVRNDGFSVFNLAEKHKGGCGMDVSYVMGEHAAMTVRVNREFFSEPAVSEGCWSTGIIALFSVSF